MEHYFEPYGGYSPSPLLFLAAASQRTANARLLTGALLPVFNHPLKMAREIDMLDAISNGHLDQRPAANFDSQVTSRTIWVGAPEDVRQQISGYAQEVGGFDTGSLQVNFHLVSAPDTATSMRLFAQQVIPLF